MTKKPHDGSNAPSHSRKMALASAAVALTLSISAINTSVDALTAMPLGSVTPYSEFGCKTKHFTGCSSIYSVQQGFTFKGNYKSVAVDVVATEQQAKNGASPAYLLNGLAMDGIKFGGWYQIGVEYIGKYKRFMPVVKVTSPADSATPLLIGGVVIKTDGIKPNDTVRLAEYFSKGAIIMHLHDLDTNYSINITYPSFGANYFTADVPAEIYANAKTIHVQKPLSLMESNNMFFTGVMTQWFPVGKMPVGSAKTVEYKEVYGSKCDEYKSAYVWSNSLVPIGLLASEKWYGPKPLFYTEMAVTYQEGAALVNSTGTQAIEGPMAFTGHFKGPSSIKKFYESVKRPAYNDATRTVIYPEKALDAVVKKQFFEIDDESVIITLIGKQLPYDAANKQLLRTYDRSVCDLGTFSDLWLRCD